MYDTSERGIEVSAGYGFTPELRADVSYTFFDFEVKDPGLEQAGQTIVPNTIKKCFVKCTVLQAHVPSPRSHTRGLAELAMMQPMSDTTLCQYGHRAEREGPLWSSAEFWAEAA